MPIFRHINMSYSFVLFISYVVYAKVVIQLYSSLEQWWIIIVLHSEQLSLHPKLKHRKRCHQSFVVIMEKSLLVPTQEKT